MKPLISADQLGCERGGLLLFDELSFFVDSGEIVQIVGPNGCGKTTLLRFLAGLSTAHDGKIITSSDAKLSTLYIGHKLAVKAMLTPLENLSWYFPARTNIEIIDALGMWKLDGYENQPCYQLSAGQQQRVALTRLLLSEDALWLLDEPFTALDQSGVGQLEKLIVLHAEKGKSVVLTTHHPLSPSKHIRIVQMQQVSS